MVKYIDYGLTKKYPNKYHLTPKTIRKLRILDWDMLKKVTWHNNAKKGSWWCHLEGCQFPKSAVYNDTNEFWIGFNEDNNKIDYNFSCLEGMCIYKFDEFYSIDGIGNTHDINVQVNAIRWLNTLIDMGVLGLPQET